jgi:protocatechuate 3,4-dioxygenase beta subunit
MVDALKIETPQGTLTLSEPEAKQGWRLGDSCTLAASSRRERELLKERRTERRLAGSRWLAVPALVSLAACAAPKEKLAGLDWDTPVSPIAISIELTHDGTPVEGAEIKLRWAGRWFWGLFDRHGNGGTERTEVGATTSAGRFERELVGAPQVLARIEKQGFAVEHRFFNALQKNVCSVELSREAACAGRVRDEFGRPVPGAVVDVEDEDALGSIRERGFDIGSWNQVVEGRYLRGGAWIRDVLTGADGRFSVSGLAAGRRYTFNLMLPFPHVNDAVFERSCPLVGEELTVYCGATLQIELHHRERTSPGVRDVEFVLLRLDGTTWLPASSLGAVLDTARNVISFGPLPAGAYVVAVRAPGAGVGATHPITIEAGESARRVVELSTGHTLTGRVVDTRGEPIPGALVNLGTSPRSETAARTDDGGVFALEVPDADACLVVSHEGFESCVAPALKESAALGTVVLVKEPPH